MDSVRPRPAPTDRVSPDETLGEVREAEAPARRSRVVRALSGAVRVAWRTAALGAAGGMLVWAALFERSIVAGTTPWIPALVVALVLLIPAGASALLGWTLGDLVSLPGQLREAAGTVKVPTREGGLRGLFETVWAMRGLVVGSTEAYARTAGLVRLASLPFVLGLLGLVALNAVLAIAGAIALLVLIL